MIPKIWAREVSRVLHPQQQLSTLINCPHPNTIVVSSLYMISFLTIFSNSKPNLWIDQPWSALLISTVQHLIIFSTHSFNHDQHSLTLMSTHQYWSVLISIHQHSSVLSYLITISWWEQSLNTLTKWDIIVEFFWDSLG